MAFALRGVARLPGTDPSPGPNWAPRATSAIRAAESRARWARDVAQALETLRPDERCFIQLSYFDGLGHAQIAERAGVSASIVSRAIAAGMRQLALMLEQA